MILILLMIRARKKYIFADKPLSSRTKLIFAFISISLVSFNIYAVIRIYNITYNPDYEYEKTTKQVNFHIYTPSVLPNGRIQDSKFFIYDKDLYGTKNSVRVVYDTPLTLEHKNNEIPSIFITQAKVNPGFDIKNEVISQEKQDSNTELQFKPITLKRWSNLPAYILKRLSATEVIMLSPDNVLISILSPTFKDKVNPTDDLLLIADSLK